MQRLDADRIRGLSGVRLPHNVYKNLLKEKSQPEQECNQFNRVSVSPDQKKVEEPKSLDPSNDKNESGQKKSIEPSNAIKVSDISVEVKPNGECNVPKL